MKKYETVTLNKGTKYEKKVVRALLRYDKDGNEIPQGNKPRPVVLGSVEDFKYSPSGNIRPVSAIERAILEAIEDLEENQYAQKGANPAHKNAHKNAHLKIKRVFDLFLVHYKTTKSKKTLLVPRASTVRKMELSFQKYLPRLQYYK